MVFLRCQLLCTISLHHCLAFRMICHSLCSMSWRPSKFFKAFQIRMVKPHLNRRSEPDSYTWLQGLRSQQFGHPLRWSLSHIHTLFWMTNKVTISHLGGAQGFCTKKRHGRSMEPQSLHLVSSFWRVATILGKLPSNRVRRVLVNVHSSKHNTCTWHNMC
jgi:hypothetical protein